MVHAQEQIKEGIFSQDGESMANLGAEGGS
jgi:hypothetical protein